MESRIFCNADTELKDFIDFLVSERGRWEDGWCSLYFDDLCQLDQLKLVGLYTATLKNYERFEPLSQCDFSKEMFDLFFNPDMDNRLRLVEKIIRDFCSYYQESLQKMIDDKTSEYSTEVNEEAGRKIYTYPDNGEKVWI